MGILHIVVIVAIVATGAAAEKRAVGIQFVVDGFKIGDDQIAGIFPLILHIPSRGPQPAHPRDDLFVRLGRQAHPQAFFHPHHIGVRLVADGACAAFVRGFAIANVNLPALVPRLLPDRKMPHRVQYPAVVLHESLVARRGRRGVAPRPEHPNEIRASIGR